MIVKAISLLVKLSLSFSYIWDLIWAPFWKRSMKHCGIMEGFLKQ